MAARDMYDRKPISQSRGKTVQRIMDLQHAAGELPGATQLLVDRPEGSIAAAIHAFHTAWVEERPVTARRAYERSLALFAHDLAEQGPALTEPVTVLDGARIAAHLQWRLDKGLHDGGELQRAMLHLARLLEYAGEQLGVDLAVDRDALRAAAADQIAAAPPLFHVAASSDELRDTSAEAARLDPPG